MPKKISPVEMINRHIAGVIMNELRFRGLSFITLFDGGRDASAMAANVSIIRFTQSIWVTVSGDSVPMNAPASTIRHAARLTVSWKSTKRCMLR